MGSETARTFVFYNEGHTLGNPMRTIMMQQLIFWIVIYCFREGVDFCGYSVPHPVEAKMHLRVQTSGILFLSCLWWLGESATKALVKGLQTFEHICDVIEDRYNTAMN